MSFSRIFLDLDGTVYVDGKIIENVDFEIRRLSGCGVKFHYMTNNTSVSTETYSRKLINLGLPYEDDSIVSPTLILSNWLRENLIHRVFLIGTDDFCEEVITKSSVVNTSDDPQCVIVSFDKELTYAKLEIACRLINSGIPYYLTHIDMACPTHMGPVPDCGAIGALIQKTTDVEPMGHFGKPGDLLLNYVKNKLLTKEDKIVVAGDRLYTDAMMGVRLGAHTVLVCTGEFKKGDQLNNMQVNVYENLSKFLQLL
jgi:4-nitrophenyl phosphatase